MQSEGQIPVTLDLNKLIEAHNKSDFMAKVFKDFLKENPSVLVEALRNYILQDMIKDGTMTRISDHVKASLTELVTSENLKGSHIFSTAVNECIRESVKAQASIINSKVSQAIQTQGVAENIKQMVIHQVERRLDQVLTDLRDE